jgi:hypothetical protein
MMPPTLSVLTARAVVAGSWLGEARIMRNAGRRR